MLYAAGSVREIPVNGEQLCGLTWTGEFLWFSDAVLQQIQAVDPQTGKVVQKIECPGVQTGLTTLDGLLFQVVRPDRMLRVIDPVSGNTVKELTNPRPGAELCGIEATAQGIWLGYERPTILELRDCRDLVLLDTYSVGRPVAGVTATDHFVAYADYTSAEINLLDPLARSTVISIGVNGNPTGLTWDGVRIWYCDYSSVQLRAIEVPGVVS